MALRDLACYTLNLKPTPDPKITELSAIEGRSEVSRYARVRDQVEGEVYSSAIYGEPPLPSLYDTGDRTLGR